MNSSWNVVFVDDEQAILDGLRNLLRHERKRWSMTFALGPHAALECIAAAPPDVVVCDMRMPGMDGAQLLTVVKERFPGTARIVLSGYADRETVMRTLPVAHQYLSKPCDAALLRATIDRTCSLQRLLGSDRVREVVGSISQLPSLPALYRELSALTARPDVSVREIAKVVERDPAMTGKVLQLANSAFFRSAQRVTSVLRATSYLGTEVIKSLVLSTEVFASFGPRHQRLVAEVQDDALRAARLASRFVKGRSCVDEAVNAALLHDVGRLVAATANPVHALDDASLENTHAETGAYLLGVWGLPFAIVEAVAHHHRPAVVAEGAREALAVVHAATTLAHAGTEAQLDVEFLKEAGFGDQVDRWREWAEEDRAAADGE